ncbi:MAG: bacteriohemerythrin [Synergistaceae bacterium]|jgi:hemerythrin-like metal-binding protein|nr:bacteriohemerythrin [Synergistaceae bacterium]
MWKEEYRLGVETIDSQHQQLFEMVDNLLRVIDGSEHGDYKKECADAVSFLYDYTVKHFQFEETYQASIGYADMEAHKLQHKRFIITVDNFAKRMLGSDYDMKVVKAFSGSLVAWLNYHVAETDQKIVGNKPRNVNESIMTCLESFLSSSLNVIETMVGVKQDEIKKTIPPKRDFNGDISFSINLVGDIIGSTIFTYSAGFARSVIKSLIAKDMEELDEIARSAMAETSNIIGGKATVMMSGNGKTCDISTPILLTDKIDALGFEGFHLQTGDGAMQILLSVK